MDINTIKNILEAYDSNIQQDASDGYKTFYDVEAVLEYILEVLDDIEKEIKTQPIVQGSKYEVIPLNYYGYFLSNDTPEKQIFEENQLVKYLYNSYSKGTLLILYDERLNEYFNINNVSIVNNDIIVSAFGNHLNYYDDTYNEIITLFSLRYNIVEDKTYIHNYNINLPMLAHQVKKIMNDNK